MKIFISVALVTIFGLCMLGAFVWLQLKPLEPAAVSPPATIEFRNATIIEPGIQTRPNQTLRIEKGLIVEIRDSSEAERIIRPQFIMPGLIDMHVHQPLAFGGLPEYFALLYLRHGITAVRYTGHTGTGHEVENHGQRIATGEIPGPQVFSCGPIIDGEPPLWPAAITLTSPDEAERTVETVKNQGASCIKVYTHMSPPVLTAIVNAARRHNLPVLGHVPNGIALEHSQIDDVQHLIGLPDHHHLTDSQYPYNPMVDGWDTLSETRMRAVADYSVQADVAHTPTLVFHWTNSHRDKHDELMTSTPTHLMPRFLTQAWRPQDNIRLGGQRTPETQAAMRAAYRRALDVIRVLHNRGVRIHAGTDTGNPFLIPGAALIQEVNLFEQAGMSNEMALASASIVPAKSLGMEYMVREGTTANLLVLNRDPTKDLAALDELDTVIASGSAYSAEFLHSEIRRYQTQHSNFTWDTLLPFAVDLLR